MDLVETVGKITTVSPTDTPQPDPPPGARQVTLVGGSGDGKTIAVAGNTRWVNHYGDWYPVTTDDDTARWETP